MTTLKFRPIAANSDKEITQILNFNVGAFAGSQNFEWTEESLKSELEDGWELVSVDVDKEIICALFLKRGPKVLLTRNTPLKLNFQGNGYSHEIKEFYEDYALKNKLKSVVNYCPEDNFRMISLNEGHNYKRTGKTMENAKNMVEWIKELK